MAKLVLNFHCLNRMKNHKLPLMIVLFLFLSCVLDVQDSSAWHGTSCEAENWGGFISNCCKQLSMITYAPWGTGQLFLNSTEQTNCLISMKGIKDDVLSCGNDKITSGAGGCSDYTNVDKVGRRDCSIENEESSKLEADMCSFAVLVTLTNEQRSSGSSGINLSTAGIAAILLIATWTLCRKRGHEIFITKRWYLFLQLVSYLTTNPTVVNCCYPFFYWTASDDLLSEESGSLKISSKEIYSATDNLSADNFIDQGRAGKVYKGILSNGKHVAVKHIINDGTVKTFICEVTSLPDVRHPNLVALLGSCEGVEEYFLVYELCQNGDLSEWLFGKDKSLPWITRLELAIDSAGGLWLLQTYPRGCIVLRDIKPTNILIDKNFQAKLSDFELSKVMDLGQSYVSSEVRGTFSSSATYLGLQGYQSKLKQTNASESKLNGEYSVEALDLAFNLALSCTGLKLQRPSMDQVVSKLEKALDTSTQKQSAFFTLLIKA
ncbi:unnamed protein product [Malus baccata var. baccata]